MKAEKSGLFKILMARKEVRAFSFIVIFLSITMIILALVIGNNGWPGKLSELGDFFNGIVGPALSLITIILIFNSYMVQREELATSSQALTQSVEEMKRNVEILERQEQNIRIEQLTNVVFKLLERYEVSRDRIVIHQREAISGLTTPIKGINGLHYFHNKTFDLPGVADRLREHKMGSYGPEIEEQVRLCLDIVVGEMIRYSDIYYSFHKVILTYKTMVDSQIPLNNLRHLVDVINNLDEHEVFYTKLIINKTSGYERLRKPLADAGVLTDDNHIFSAYLRHYL